ncbi:hypothetical protein [Saudi moumouvirus]|nr:hypothetical protein [Saudi moumouvirus]
MSDQNYNNKIYNPDELIADVYETIYGKQSYEIPFIDLKNADLNRFKMSDYDLDIIFNKIIYSGTYPTGIVINGQNINEIHFKRLGETWASTIRIVPYLDVNRINDKSDPVNVNQIMKTVLSELVVTDKTTNILLPIINVDVTGADLSTRDIVNEYIDNNKFYSIEITEKYYKLTDLDNFFKNYPIEPKVLKSIIYQAVDVLYQIGLIYPMFRYNQFIPDKINCYLKKTGDVIVPELKLSYFYLSNIKNLIENDYISNLEIPFIDSQYSDLYQLLNYMWNNVWVDIQKYPEIVKIFDVILPEKIRSKESYLTQEIWDRLSDDEKFNLTPRNIKNNGLFTSKDSLLNTTFMSQNNDELSGGQETDNDLTFQESEIYFPNQNSQNDDIDILDEEYNDDLHTLGSLTDPNELRTITSRQSNSSNRNESRDKRQNNLNKKYYHNHIDNMRGKRSNTRYDDDDSDRLNNTNQEYTEDRTPTNSSKLISVSDVDSDIKKSNRNNYTRQSRISDTSSNNNNNNNNNGNNRKNKAYRGKRQIINQHASGIISDRNLATLGLANNNMMNNASNISSGTQGVQMFDNYPTTFDGQGTRVNSIGSLLGVTPNEMLRPNNTNYSQISQQLSRQFQTDPSQQQYTPYGNQMLMSNMVPNNLNQLQMPMQNPIVQNPMAQNSMAQNPMAQNIFTQGMTPMTGMLPNQQENDILARYLSAANQVPGQSMSNIDPNLLSSLMQQTSQTPYLAQTGGANNNNNKNFFFR